MSGPKPTFSLPCCPRCSSRFRQERPIWGYAHRTSSTRKKDCYIWTGCDHAVVADRRSNAMQLGKNVYDDPADWARVEARWKELRVQLLLDMTSTWTEAQRALHARTCEIDLPAGPPPQLEPPKID